MEVGRLEMTDCEQAKDLHCSGIVHILGLATTVFGK